MLQAMKYANIRAEVGVVIFNLKKQFIFADQRAMNIFNSMDHAAENGRSKKIRIPTEVSQILSELKPKPRSLTANGRPDCACLKRFIVINSGSYLIRAFIISDQNRSSSIHFLLLLEKAARRSRISLERVRSHYHMTLRESDVVHLLVDGLTNKEIGQNLNVAECTVKEYLRKVMKKVGAGTRCGVVAQVLSLSDRAPAKGPSNGEQSLPPALMSRVSSLESPELGIYTETA
jgi:DNA-binding CsgD family transcriptional regulator